MTDSTPALVTPIYLKLHDDMPWPADKVFYLLSASGLWLCRNHPFFLSCVPAPRWPTELTPQAPFLMARYPTIPQPLLEQVVGFFAEIGELHGAEAAVLLAWERNEQRVCVVVPPQVATVTRPRSGRPYAVGLDYEVPQDLPADLTLIGDIHSHVDLSAYASYVDKQDEHFRPGLHIVVGKIDLEPPQFHVEAVVDGTRFRVAPEMVFEGYEHRCTEVPAEWVAKVEIKPCGGYSHTDSKENHDGRG